MGHPDLTTPYNRSELAAMVEALMKHHHEMHDQDRTVTADLRFMLPRAQGARTTFEHPVAVVNARRVVRHLIHAGALNLAAAKAYRKAWTTYLELFENRKPVARHGKVFTTGK